MPNAVQDYATLPFPLTPVEAEDLHDYEATIQRGLNSFYDVAAAFVHIKQRKLYRAEYRTFEEYCREKWHVDRSYADRMIEAAEVRENLVPIGTVLPEKESHARALMGLTPEQQRQVWPKAVETAPNGKVTAQHIKDVRQVELSMPEPTAAPVAAPVKQMSVSVPQEQPRPTSLLKDKAVCLVCGKLSVFVDRDSFMTCQACGEKTNPAKYRKLLVEGKKRCKTCRQLTTDYICRSGYGYGWIECPYCEEPAFQKVLREEFSRDPVDYELHAELEADDDDPWIDVDREPEAVVSGVMGSCHFCDSGFVPVEQLYSSYRKDNTLRGHICRACASKALHELLDPDDPEVIADSQDKEQAFHFMHQDRARMCAAGLTVLRVDLYKRIIFEYHPQNGGAWKPRLKCRNDGEMIDAVQNISAEPNTIFENRL